VTRCLSATWPVGSWALQLFVGVIDWTAGPVSIHRAAVAHRFNTLHLLLCNHSTFAACGANGGLAPRILSLRVASISPRPFSPLVTCPGRRLECCARCDSVGKRTWSPRSCPDGEDRLWSPPRPYAVRERLRGEGKAGHSPAYKAEVKDSSEVFVCTVVGVFLRDRRTRSQRLIKVDRRRIDTRTWDPRPLRREIKQPCRMP
jgi:hypothetical protein